MLPRKVREHLTHTLLRMMTKMSVPIIEGVLKDPHKVSNSMVVTFQTCKQRYHLCYDLNLEPKLPGTALYRGTVGHAMLEAYFLNFLHLMPGEKTEEIWDRAEKAAWRVYGNYLKISEDFQDEVLLDLRPIMQRYFKYARGYEGKTAFNSNTRDWIILQVEKYYDLDLTDDFKYVARLDLVARINGRVVIVDHKFIYNFWTQDKLDLNPQLPKYVGIMRNNGIRVDEVMVNQIRYRPKKRPPYYTDEEMFKYAFYTPTVGEVNNHLREQIKISRDVVTWREQPMEERALNATRLLNDMVCQSCPVKSLCIMGLKGVNISAEMAAHYQPNTYDYNTRALEEAGVSY